jgi:FRG domain-containing protein
MAKREISNLDLKIKLFKEYLDNGGLKKIVFPDLLRELMKVKKGPDGKADPDTVSARVNAMMLAILVSHSSPPFYHEEHISEYKSTLQKRNSFVQENIDTTEQFDKVYDEYKIKVDTLFRGQREAKWRLYSSLQRNWLKGKMFASEESYQHFIEMLVEIGKNDFGMQIKELLIANNINIENSISTLGFLQHHGCPSPLLDWTYKFQNALYFAIDGLTSNPGTIEIEEYCSVYYIEEKYFEEANLRTIIDKNLSIIEEPILQDLISEIAGDDEEKRKAMEVRFKGRKLFDREKATKKGVVDHMTKISHLIDVPIAYFSDKDTESGIMFSLNNSMNILNQDGVFIWNAHSAKPIELIGDELYREGKKEEAAKDYSFCSCFNIHKSLEEHIRQRLEEDGITKEFIYPTLEVSTWEVFEKAKNK